MHRRAREILTSIAAVGVGGALGRLVGKRRSGAGGRALDSRRGDTPRSTAVDAIPENIDAIDTTPTGVEVVVVDVIEVRVADEGDDRADGETWIEDMLVGTTMDVPADRPLAIDDRRKK